MSSSCHADTTPGGAPYGFEMYYLNVMAGPLRKWRFVAAPEVEWIMERDA